MTQALRTVGPALRHLPDGETGDRVDWIASTVRRLREHPDLEVARDGDLTSYRQSVRLRVRGGHRLTTENLDLGYLAAYRSSRPVFDRLRDRAGRPDLLFQVGVASDLDVTAFAFGLPGLVRHRRTVADRIAGDISQIHASGGDDVIFQVEVPGELVAVAGAPGPLRAALAAWMSRSVVTQPNRAPLGARFGVHLCYGDLGHRAVLRPGDTSALVRLANAVARRWPPGRPLEYLHAPLAAGDEPPPLEPEFYAGLAGLRLPGPTRFVAGFVHEGRTLDEHRRIMDYVDRAVGCQVDIAAACGLSRRGPAAAATVLNRTAELCAL